MFGLFKKKSKDAKPADKSTAKAPAKAAPPKDPKAVKAAAPKDAKAPAPTDKKAVKKADEQAALKAAIAAMEEVLPPEKVSAGANLDRAKEALAKKGSAPMDRKALIEQALAIQKTQAKMLDKLPEETRNKLRDMAMKAFVIEEPKSKDQKKKMN